MFLSLRILFVALSLWLIIVAVSAFPCPSCRPETRRNIVDRRRQDTTTSSTQLFATKKKKGKKKSNTPEQSGFAWAASFQLHPYEAQSTRDLASMAVASYAGRKSGQPLCQDIVGVADIPKALWRATDTACLIVSCAHNQKADATGDDGETAAAVEAPSQVVYANLAALETVGLTGEEWDQLITMPGPKASAASAGEDNLPSRIEIDVPTDMKDKAYQSGYQKKILRKNKEDPDSHDVTLLNAERWRLEKSVLVNGKFVTTPVAVAYAWKEWALDEDTICAPGGQCRERVPEQELQALVDQQASYIRELKETQGLGNKDPKVQDAVAELLRLKSLMESSA